MSPEYVQPYVKAQQERRSRSGGDRRGGYSANMRFVALKTERQLEVQLLHPARDRLVSQRTSLINQMRSILRERGAQGRRKLLDGFEMLSFEAGRSRIGARVHLLLQVAQWRGLDERITALDDEFAADPQ